MTCPRLLACLLLVSPALVGAQAPDWASAQRVEVRLSSFDFTPSTLRLRANRPVVLHLVNTGSGGHDFTAPDFFAAARVRPRDRRSVGRGRIELRGHQSIDIALVPKAGTYKLKCSHAFHKTLGMAGRIVVD